MTLSTTDSLIALADESLVACGAAPLSAGEGQGHVARSPITGTALGTVPAGPSIDDVIDRAATAFSVWRTTPAPHRGELVRRIGEQLGINPETLRGWVTQAEVDVGTRPGTSTSDAQRLAQLEWENRELRRTNAILRSASAFFAAELDRPHK